MSFRALHRAGAAAAVLAIAVCAWLLLSEARGSDGRRAPAETTPGHVGESRYVPVTVPLGEASNLRPSDEVPAEHDG